MSTWPPCAFLYDGTFPGFLSCVGESFRRKEYPFYFLPPGAKQVSPYPLREIGTDPYLAKLIYNALAREVSESFRQLVEDSFRTGLPQKERHIFDAVYLGLTHALPRDREDERVRLLRRAVRGVNFLSGSPASRTAPPAPRAWTGER